MAFLSGVRQLWSNNVVMLTSKGQYLYFLFSLSTRMSRLIKKMNTKYYFFILSHKKNVNST